MLSRPWSVSPKDNSTLAAAYRETVKVIRFWDSRTGDQLGRNVELPSQADPESIKYSPDGQHLVCGQRDSESTTILSVVDVETQQLVAISAGHSGTVSEVAFGTIVLPFCVYLGSCDAWPAHRAS